MTVGKQPETKGVVARLESFNNRLGVKIRKNQEMLENMYTEKNLRKTWQYVKEFFEFK